MGEVSIFILYSVFLISFGYFVNSVVNNIIYTASDDYKYFKVLREMEIYVNEIIVLDCVDRIVFYEFRGKQFSAMYYRENGFYEFIPSDDSEKITMYTIDQYKKTRISITNKLLELVGVYGLVTDDDSESDEDKLNNILDKMLKNGGYDSLTTIEKNFLDRYNN